jgi:hypothetical protein
VGTKGNTRAVAYPVVVGSCPQFLRTHVDHVRLGFDGILAQYKYYIRALSPIHIRVVFDQGPPELSDEKERWVYKLLATTYQQLQFKHHLSEMITIELADRLMAIIVTGISRRLRCSALLALGIYVYTYIYIYILIY